MTFVGNGLTGVNHDLYFVLIFYKTNAVNFILIRMKKVSREGTVLKGKRFKTKSKRG